MLLCAFVGVAWAQTPIQFDDFDASKTYRVYNQITKDGVQEDVKAWIVNNGNRGWLANYSLANYRQVWQFIPGEGENVGKYLLYNVETKRYLQQVDGSNGVGTTDAKASATYYTMVQKEGDATKVKFVSSNQAKHTLFNDGAEKLAGWENDDQEWFSLEVANYPTAVANLSELSNEKVYSLKNANGLGYVIYSPTNNADKLWLCSATAKNTYTDYWVSTDANQSWHILSASGKYFLYNAGAKKFAVTCQGATYLTETPTPINIKAVNGGFAFNSTDNESYYMCAAHHLNPPVQWWTASDAGSSWVIMENTNVPSVEGVAELVESIAKSIVVAEIEEFVSSVDASEHKLVGEFALSAVLELGNLLDQYKKGDVEYETLLAEYEYVLANGARVGLESGDIFTIENIDNRGWVVYSTVADKGSETHAYLGRSSSTQYHPTYNEAGVYNQWSVVKHDGKTYIYNVENKKFLAPDGSLVKFVDTPYAVQIEEIKVGVSAIGFVAAGNYMEVSPGYNDKAVRTYNKNGVGSHFYLRKTGDKVSSEVSAVVEKTLVNGWKQVTLELVDLGYVGAYKTSQKTAIENVQTLAQVSEFEATGEKVEMAPGYYFIKKVNNSKYVTVDGINMMATATAEGINQIWKFEQIDGGYSLKHANLDAFVALEDAAANGGSATKVNSAEGATFTLEDMGNAQQLLKSNGQPMRTEGGGQVNYWWGDTNTTWYLIPATELEVTVTEAGYATLNLPFDVTLPNTVKAYAVETVEGGYASLVEKADIPADQGAILEGVGPHTLTIAAASSDWTNNKLVGTNVNTYVEGEAYVLGKDGEGAGFFKAALNKNEAGEEGTTHFLNNANKAYLPASAVPAGAKALRFNFGGTTAIESVVTGLDTNAAIYDLSGRRVEKAVKGIYIQNGKKIIVK